MADEKGRVWMARDGRSASERSLPDTRGKELSARDKGKLYDLNRQLRQDGRVSGDDPEKSVEDNVKSMVAAAMAQVKAAGTKAEEEKAAKIEIEEVQGEDRDAIPTPTGNEESPAPTGSATPMSVVHTRSPAKIQGESEDSITKSSTKTLDDGLKCGGIDPQDPEEPWCPFTGVRLERNVFGENTVNDND